MEHPREQVSVYNGVNPHPVEAATLLEVFNHVQTDASLLIRTTSLRRLLDGRGKDAFDRVKCRLPAVTFAGVFSRRAKSALKSYSGLAPLDVDQGVDDPAGIRDALYRLPWIALAYISPSARGVKAVARLNNSDPTLHGVYTAHACQLVRGLLGDVVNLAQHDYSRLSFLAADREAWFRPAGPRLHVHPEALHVTARMSQRAVPSHRRSGQDTPLPDWQVELRRGVAERVIGAIEWTDEATGYCVCPGAFRHTHRDKADDCRVVVSGVPSVSCYHTSCSAEIVDANRELRSRVAIEEKSSRALALKRGGAQ